MNTTSNMMTAEFVNDFEMCQSDHLFQFTTVSQTAMSSSLIYPDYIQTISIIIASIIGICSMIYGIITSCFSKGLTLHFVGIRRPKQFSKSQYKLSKNIDTASTMITIQTSLKPDNTIADLKQLIKKTYSIQNTNDIIISYSSHILSLYQNSEQLTLAECGITNNSLLTLGVCNTDKVQIEEGAKYLGVHRTIFEKVNSYEPFSDPVHSVNQLFDMFQDEEDEQYPDTEPVKEEQEPPKGFLEPYLGFDIIMQCGGVMVYRMPTCGHEMNKESLYEYALKEFENTKNLKLQCPHHDRDGKCQAEWDLTAVLEVLRHEHSTENSEQNNEEQLKMEDVMKLELLMARNKVENGGCNVQKCPRCKTLYFKNANESKMKLDQIKTAQHIEQEFKTQCVFCEPAVPSNIDLEAMRIGTKSGDDAAELERAKAINAMFDMFQNEEDEEEQEDIVIANEYDEDDEVDIDRANAVNAMFGMFQDDENEDEDGKQEEDELKYDENGYPILAANNSFCFCCGEEWINGHICDNAFIRDLVEILDKAPGKKIGKVEEVPSIRCCPNCCQLLFHIDCCKHMKCTRCKTNFCMVCLKTKKNGSWQCGSSGSVCPIAPRQDRDTLPDNIVLTKQQFRLFDEVEAKKEEKANDKQ